MRGMHAWRPSESQACRRFLGGSRELCGIRDWGAAAARRSSVVRLSSVAVAFLGGPSAKRVLEHRYDESDDYGRQEED